MPKKIDRNSPLARFNETKEAIRELLHEILTLCDNNFYLHHKEVDFSHVKDLAVYEERLLEITLNAKGTNAYANKGKPHDTQH